MFFGHFEECVPPPAPAFYYSLIYAAGMAYFCSNHPWVLICSPPGRKATPHFSRFNSWNGEYFLPAHGSQPGCWWCICFLNSSSKFAYYIPKVFVWLLSHYSCSVPEKFRFCSSSRLKPGWLFCGQSIYKSQLKPHLGESIEWYWDRSDPVWTAPNTQMSFDCWWRHSSLGPNAPTQSCNLIKEQTEAVEYRRTWTEEEPHWFQGSRSCISLLVLQSFAMMSHTTCWSPLWVVAIAPCQVGQYCVPVGTEPRPIRTLAYNSTDKSDWV